MNSQKLLKIEMINRLVKELELKTGEYNNMVQPQHEAIAARSSDARLGVTTAGRSSAPLFSQDANKRMKILDAEIEELSKRIEKLDQEVYGKSDRSSPSFTMTRK